MTKYYFYLTFFLIACSMAISGQKPKNGILSVPISSPTEFIRQDFDVLHYDASLDLTKSPSLEMSGVCKITFLWLGRPDTSKFYFHLRSLTIDSAFLNNERTVLLEVGIPDSATYHWEVTTNKGKAGDTANLVIYYHGTMTSEPGNSSLGGVFSSGNCLYSIGVGFHNNYVCTTQHWMPCYDLPSDKASFDFHFMVKKGNFVASNGVLADTVTTDSTVTYHWHSSYPTATYLYTFAVDDYVPIDYSTKDLPIVVYSQQENVTASKYAFEFLPKMVTFLSTIYGAYPFEKVGYVLTPTTAGAMESQTMIVFPIIIVTYKYTIKDSDNYTALHELSHHWFGDEVTCRDFRDTWLNESFATYSESLWMGFFIDKKAKLDDLYKKISYYINQDAPSEGIFPIYNYPRIPPSTNYPNTIYRKGSVVLGMLNNMLGIVYFDIMKKYISDNAYSTQTTDGFKQTLEKVTGQNFDWFFNQWIYGIGWPQLSLYINSVPYPDKQYSKAYITITQEQPSDWGYNGLFTNLMLELTFKKPDNTKFNRIITMTDIKQTFFLDSLPYFTDVLHLNSGDSLRTLMYQNSLILNVDSDVQPDRTEKILVLPNPASNKAVVQFNSYHDSAILKVYDSQFREMLNYDIETTRGINNYPIDIDSCASGVYYVRLQQGKTISWGSFQVVK